MLSAAWKGRLEKPPTISNLGGSPMLTNLRSNFLKHLAEMALYGCNLDAKHKVPATKTGRHT